MRQNLRIALVMFSFGSLVYADTFVVIGSRAAQNPTDTIDWTQLGADGSSFTSRQSVVSFGGQNDLVGNTNGTNFLRVDEGNSWVGNFDFGESLIWTGPGGTFGAGPGPFGMVLQNPAGSFGFSIQPNDLGAFSVDVKALDAGFNVLFDHTFNGVSTSLENGSALFVGLGDTTGANISEILISAASATTTNDFAIDDPSFTYTTATPEPRSIAIVLTALLGVGGLARKFRF